MYMYMYMYRCVYMHNARDQLPKRLKARAKKGAFSFHTFGMDAAHPRGATSSFSGRLSSGLSSRASSSGGGEGDSWRAPSSSPLRRRKLRSAEAGNPEMVDPRTDTVRLLIPCGPGTEPPNYGIGLRVQAPGADDAIVGFKLNSCAESEGLLRVGDRLEAIDGLPLNEAGCQQRRRTYPHLISVQRRSPALARFILAMSPEERGAAPALPIQGLLLSTDPVAGAVALEDLEGWLGLRMQGGVVEAASLRALEAGVRVGDVILEVADPAHPGKVQPVGDETLDYAVYSLVHERDGEDLPGLIRLTIFRPPATHQGVAHGVALEGLVFAALENAANDAPHDLWPVRPTVMNVDACDALVAEHECGDYDDDAPMNEMLAAVSACVGAGASTARDALVAGDYDDDTPMDEMRAEVSAYVGAGAAAARRAVTEVSESLHSASASLQSASKERLAGVLKLDGIRLKKSVPLNSHPSVTGGPGGAGGPGGSVVAGGSVAADGGGALDGSGGGDGDGGDRTSQGGVRLAQVLARMNAANEPVESEADALKALTRALPPVSAASPAEMAAALLQASRQLQRFFQLRSDVHGRISRAELEGFILDLTVSKAVVPFAHRRTAVRGFVGQLCSAAKQEKLRWHEVARPAALCLPPPYAGYSLPYATLCPMPPCACRHPMPAIAYCHDPACQLAVPARNSYPRVPSPAAACLRCSRCATLCQRPKLMRHPPHALSQLEAALIALATGKRTSGTSSLGAAGKFSLNALRQRAVKAATGRVRTRTVALLHHQAQIGLNAPGPPSQGSTVADGTAQSHPFRRKLSVYEQEPTKRLQWPTANDLAVGEHRLLSYEEAVGYLGTLTTMDEAVRMRHRTQCTP